MASQNDGKEVLDWVMSTGAFDEIRKKASKPVSHYRP